MEIAEIVLRYLQVILNWPLAIFILGLIFLISFKNQISDFLRRLVKGEAYGVRLEATSPSEQRKEVKEPESKIQGDIETYIRDHPKQVAEKFKRLYEDYSFERIFNIIYGTQINLLEHLSAKKSKGDNYINLVSFYSEFTKRSGLDITQMKDYIGFLDDSGLIIITGKNDELTVKITPRGTDFLSYIKSLYPSAYRSKPF